MTMTTFGYLIFKRKGVNDFNSVILFSVDWEDIDISNTQDSDNGK